MFSTPLIWSSIGATTVAATMSALAPGYWPCSLMIGGAISGNCATGSRANDTAPRMTNAIETTAAKIGRSMKKCEILMPVSIRLRLPAGGGRRCRALLLRRHLAARARPYQSVHDHAVVGRKSRFDDAQVVHDVAERHVFHCDGVVGANGQHVFARLFGADGRIWHQQRLVGRRARDAHAGEHAGREEAGRIVEHRAAADRTGRTVDHVVDEVHAAAMAEILLVDEPERDRSGGPTLAILVVFGQSLVAQERRFIEGEFEPDRIG